jgi:hypothetical protein
MTRSRLLTQLDDASRFALTFLSAPAGYGKTTLLSQWVSTRENKTPWVSLDEADNSLSQAVTTVVKAIQHVEPFVGNQTLSLLNTSQIETPSYLAAILVDEMAAVAKPVTIILDDFHVLDDDDDVLLFPESSNADRISTPSPAELAAWLLLHKYSLASCECAPCLRGVLTACIRRFRLDAKRPGSLNGEPGHNLTIDPILSGNWACHR